jgi:hypothetical protein
MRNALIFLRRTRSVASLTARLLAFVAVATSLVFAESQNAHAQQRDRQSNKTRAGEPQGPAEPTPTSVVQINQAAPQPNQPAATTQADQAKTLRRVFDERLIDPVTWFTGFLLLVGFLQWRVMRRQAKVAETQNEIMVRQESIMDAQRRTTDLMLTTNKEIERAYIFMTHKDVSVRHPSDGKGDLDMSKPQSITVGVLIRNSGRTPGDFLGGYFGFRIAPTPGIPGVTQAFSSLTPAFLFPDGHVEFVLTVNVSDNPTLHDVLTGKGEDRLWLIGEADYSDRFGQKHTGGYGRCLVRHPDGRFSFSFVSETGPFNYDRPMTPEKEKHYGAQS